MAGAAAAAVGGEGAPRARLEGWAGEGGVAVLTSMMELEVADLDSRLGGAAGTLSSGMEVEAAELVSGLAQEWLRLLQPQKNVINKL